MPRPVQLTGRTLTRREFEDVAFRGRRIALAATARRAMAASRAVIDLIHNRARTLVYSTALPAAVVAAAIAALDLIEREPAYAARPLEKAKAFTRMAGLPDAQSPIAMGA